MPEAVPPEFVYDDYDDYAMSPEKLAHRRSLGVFVSLRFKFRAFTSVCIAGHSNWGISLTCAARGHVLRYDFSVDHRHAALN